MISCKTLITSLTFFASGIFFIATDAQAASFDCARADTKVAKQICGDAQLSKSDEALAAAYAQALKDAADPQSLKKQQRDWVVNVQSRCPDIGCLRSAYTTRIAALSATGKDVKPLSKADEGDPAVCRTVADFANRGELKKLATDAVSTATTPQSLKRLFGARSEEFSSPEYWSIDLDHDGTPDHFVISTEGTMRASAGYAVAAKKGSPVSELADMEEGNIDLNILKVGGRHYILSGSDDILGKLWRMRTDGAFQIVCQFSQRAKPIVELVKGKDVPVCMEANSGRIQSIAYSGKHALGKLPDEDRFWSKRPMDGFAKVDIDNDGKPDNVVRIDFNHGAGRGCGATYIAVTDETRTRIPDSKLNRLLFDELGGTRCGPDLSVVVHAGVTYVDAHAGAGNRTIHRIKNDKAELVCEFRGLLINDVVDSKKRLKK